MYIYKTTNLINNKIYIGLSTKEIEKSTNYFGSGKNITAAISRYGKENFTKEILFECDTLEVLKEEEKAFILKYNSTDRTIGYNISPGGDINSTEQRVEIYQYALDGTFIKYFQTIEDAVELTGDRNLYRTRERNNRPFKGYWYTMIPHTQEEILVKQTQYLYKISKARKLAAAKRHSDPMLAQFYKENIRLAQSAVTNFDKSEDTKQKISESIKGRQWYYNPENPSDNGQYHTPPDGWIRGRGKKLCRPSGLKYKNSSKHHDASGLGR